MYIPLEKVGDLPEDSLTSEFTKESFTVSIENYKPDVILRLAVKDLEGEVSIQSMGCCSMKVSLDCSRSF